MSAEGSSAWSGHMSTKHRGRPREAAMGPKRRCSSKGDGWVGGHLRVVTCDNLAHGKCDFQGPCHVPKCYLDVG